MTNWYSLQRRTLALLLAVTGVVWLGITAFSYADAQREIDALFDAQLAQSAQALLVQGQAYTRREAQRGRATDGHEKGAREKNERDKDGHEKEEHHEKPHDGIRGHRYQSTLVFQVFDRGGALIDRSLDAPDAPLVTRAAPDGYADGVDKQGRRWRYYSQWDAAQRYRITVAENQAVRAQLETGIAWKLLLPFLLGLPILAVATWFALWRGMRPLTRLADAVARNSPESLQALQPEYAPREVRPLVEALNQLFARVRTALENERRFTADAAHELRTPLAALAVQTQVAQRARNVSEREHALAQLAAGIVRATRLIEQLLTLARLDPTQALPAPTQLDLAALVCAVCAEHAAAAMNKNIALSCTADEAGVFLFGDADYLRILVRNVVDNALRYTPNNGRVDVCVTIRHENARSFVELCVADSGPGIPPEARAQVFERFRRLAGQEIAGSGLGLAIVRRIAELHAAAITLDKAALGGLAVRVEFARPSQDQRKPAI